MATAVLQRLQSVVGLVPPQLENSCRWQFHEQLIEKNKNIDFFKPLIKTHGVLNIEYSVLCTQLAHNYFRPNRNEAEITEQLVCAFMMAELLTYIYRDYLRVPREVRRLQKEQAIYWEVLIKRGFDIDNLTPISVQEDTITQKIRATTASTNWLRLFLVRSKRVINASVPLAKNFEQYAHFVNFLDKFANPLITYISWIFFVPRLSTNLFLLLKHVIPGPWMDENEKKLGWILRLQAQLQRRWFEIANDSVWMIAGLLNCFLWIGPLAPVGIYINVALQVYDVALASIRAGIEISRLRKLQAYYQNLSQTMEENNASPQAMLEITRFQKHLEEHISFEQKRLMIGVVNTTALVVAVIICIPALAVNPVIPLIGAILLVTITIAAYLATKLVDRQRPGDKIQSLIAPENLSLLAPRERFFKQDASKNNLHEHSDVDLNLTLTYDQ